MKTETTYTYFASIEGGDGGETQIVAANLADAVRQARDWAEAGDYDHAEPGAEIDLRVWREETDEDGEFLLLEETSVTVEVPPLAPYLDGLELMRSDLGDGGWSLHLPDSECHPDDTLPDRSLLVSGEAERVGGDWSRPDSSDYAAAARRRRAQWCPHCGLADGRHLSGHECCPTSDGAARADYDVC